MNDVIFHILFLITLILIVICGYFFSRKIANIDIKNKTELKRYTIFYFTQILTPLTVVYVIFIFYI